MPGRSDPETYLRLACERTLLTEDSGRGIREGFEGAVIRRVLTAAGTLPAEAGLHVLEEYRLAMALRGGHRGHMFKHGQAMVQTQRQRLSAQRVVVGDHDFERGNDRWRLERLIFADDGCQLKLSGTDLAGARPSRHHMVMGRPGPHGRPSRTICKDRVLRNPADIQPFSGLTAAVSIAPAANSWTADNRSACVGIRVHSDSNPLLLSGCDRLKPKRE